jgi:hypothetical protein
MLPGKFMLTTRTTRAFSRLSGSVHRVTGSRMEWRHPVSPDLTHTEQDYVDAFSLQGPGRVERVEMGCVWIVWPGQDSAPLGADEVRSLLARGLLLERERTVECGRCKGEVWTIRYDSEENEYEESCSACDSGSVKERVIGVPCSECHGQVGAPLSSRIGCTRCASTPTPGLDPGSESEAR